MIMDGSLQTGMSCALCIHSRLLVGKRWRGVGENSRQQVGVDFIAPEKATLSPLTTIVGFPDIARHKSLTKTTPYIPNTSV